MLYKIFIVFLVLAMLGALGSSLFFLLKDRGQGKRTLLGLASRVGIAVLLLGFLLLGLATGLIRPSAPWTEAGGAEQAESL